LHSPFPARWAAYRHDLVWDAPVFH
jgi:hypothetical protein